MEDIMVEGAEVEAVQASLFPAAELPQIRGDDWAFLRSREPELGSFSKKVRAVDLFSGCGGISLGLREAAAEMNLGFEVALAADFEKSALGVFNENFRPGRVLEGPLESVFSMHPGSSFSIEERRLARELAEIDILVGGPPCQGHSDLNNSTRRSDPKNGLYILMARAAEVLRPRTVLIENVAGAFHDKSGVVQRTMDALSTLGYQVEVALLDGTTVGLPQRRKRLLILASLSSRPRLSDRLESYKPVGRDIKWAIGDLVGMTTEDLLDQPAVSNKDTKARIDYLFENDLYDLPDPLRPPCHRDKKHSYKSVYGRLSWNDPAQTVTSGFYSMCMGRYVHPSCKRTLTAREAARLQFFPDFFSFKSVQSRTALATIIGNAVPPKLSFVAGIELLSEVKLSTTGTGSGKRLATR